MIRMTEKTKWRHMASVKQQWKDGSGEAALEIANALVTDIRSNWGTGGAPNMDTGNLDSAIMVNPQGRDDSGRFAKGDSVTTYFVTANAPDGDSYHGRGNYSRPLEEGWNNGGDHGPFPFMQPAMERVMVLYPSVLKRKVTK